MHLHLPGKSDANDAEPDNAEANDSTTVAVSGASKMARTALQSLTPKFDQQQHGTYLARLEQAVKDPHNLNIALTGRYGAGKSSVLAQFASAKRATTRQLAIAALVPEAERQDTTNRLQKEIVKQLVYSASRKVGKNSHFSKIAPLSVWEAARQVTALTGVGALLLYLLGWLPKVTGTGPGHSGLAQSATWLLLAVAVIAVGTVIRQLAHGRFVTDVSAAGAAVSLTDRPDSVFDKYLDEIVHYFDRESVDYVIFEDLDRFEDPRIFEALRELNLLLNETPQRSGRAGKSNTRPLRFIYAVKDSVFAKLDAPESSPQLAASPGKQRDGVASDAASSSRTERLPDDAAAAETRRANRTKFFDIVIPVVPFISHRNARDLLAQLLDERDIDNVDRALQNVIARHCTDMRLLRNICNEYLVFGERLLEGSSIAPGMTASHLFALVTYKNFHPEDFELIARGESDLDVVYALYQRIIRESMSALEADKRHILAGRAVSDRRDARAKNLSDALLAVGTALGTHYLGSQPTTLQFRADTVTFEGTQSATIEFWQAVAKAPQVDVVATYGGYNQYPFSIAKPVLRTLLRENLDDDGWAEQDGQATAEQLTTIEQKIALLRRAEFRDVLLQQEFVTAVPAGPGDDPADGHDSADGRHEQRNFQQLIEDTLRSQLASELIAGGYLDRNYTLYAAQFYGNFTGVDVATYMVHHVQTKTMAVDFNLSAAGAVANLLDEAHNDGQDLLSSPAALNIDIANYVLDANADDRDRLLSYLVAHGDSDDTRTFLAAYLTSEHSSRTTLAAGLAAHRWTPLYRYLVTDERVPATARGELLSAALCQYEDDAGFDLTGDVARFIADNYQSMPAFTAAHPHHTDAGDELTSAVAERVAAAVRRADVIITELTAVDRELRQHLVEDGRYDLTADNLRTAMALYGDTDTDTDVDTTASVALDRLVDVDIVYGQCLANINTYLSAVDTDPATGYAIESSRTLTAVLNTVVGTWTGDDLTVGGPLSRLLAATAPKASVVTVSDFDPSLWPALAAAHRMRPSLSNVAEYLNEFDQLDAHVTRLLDAAEHIDTSEPTDTHSSDGDEYARETVAVAVLNAAEHLSPQRRVYLAGTVGAQLPLSVADIKVSADDLLARLLQQRMVADDAVSFAHFAAGGFDSLGPAIAVSRAIADFLSPALVEGIVDRLLSDARTADIVGPAIIGNLRDYLTDDDWPALAAAAQYARNHHVSLATGDVQRIASSATQAGELDIECMLHLLATATPQATADEVVTVLAELGKPWSAIASGSAEFEVDKTDDSETLLTVLKDAGRCTFRKATGRAVYKVAVLPGA